MTRMGKQEERRNRSPRKHSKHAFPEKTGPKKDNLEHGYKEQSNALDTEGNAFIPKIK